MYLDGIFLKTIAMIANYPEMYSMSQGHSQLDTLSLLVYSKPFSICMSHTHEDILHIGTSDF